LYTGVKTRHTGVRIGDELEHATHSKKKMDTQEMLKLLLAKMTSMEEESKVWREKIKAETEATRARTKAMQERAKAEREAD
jgi:hypothetical protein